MPKSLLVIGGGYIGLELGTVYATLGSKVSVVEMTPGLLPGADRDLVQRAAQAAREAVRRNHAEHEGGEGRGGRRTASASRSRATSTSEGADRSIACSSPSDAGRTRRFPASRPRASRWTQKASSKPTASGGPRSRPSSRSATSRASRCSRTRRRTRRASRSRRSPAQGGVRAARDSRRGLHRSGDRVVRADRGAGRGDGRRRSKSRSSPGAR